MTSSSPSPFAPADVPARSLPAAGGTQSLPLIEEQLSVSRERVSAGAVRVRVEEHRHDVPVALSAFSDAVQVERVPVEREVERVEPPRQDGDVLVVPVYEERIVVQRQLVLKEEWHIRRERRQQQWTETVALRRDEARIERRDAGGDWHADDTDADNAVARADPGRGDPASRSFPGSQRSSR